LLEIREAVEVKEQQKQDAMKKYYVDKQRQAAGSPETASDASDSVKDGSIDFEDTALINWDTISISEGEGRGKGSWVPGQGVVIDFSRTIEIFMPHLSSQG
jgi:vacuole morphology and inheritance protein 14